MHEQYIGSKMQFSSGNIIVLIIVLSFKNMEVAVDWHGIRLSVFSFSQFKRTSRSITKFHTRKATLFHWDGGKYLVCANSSSCICSVADWSKKLACNAEYKFHLH